MSNRDYLRYVIPALSATFSIFGFVLFLNRVNPALPGEWRTDFAVLLGVSLILTLLLTLFKKTVPIMVLMLIKVSVVLLLTAPLTDLNSIRILLFSGALMEIAARFSPRFSLAAFGFLAFVFLVRPAPSEAFWVPLPAPNPLDNIAAVIVSLSFGTLVVLLRHLAGELTEERKTSGRLTTSVEKLTKANSEFLQYASVVERESVVSERNRITRDLHDIVGQALTNIIMMMDAALHRDHATPEEIVKLYRWTREQAQDCLEETRAALYELRSIPQGEAAGIKSIKRLIDTYSGLTAVKVLVEWGNLPWEFDTVIGQAVYRLIQESLSNSFRHGMATLVEIHFQVDQGVLNLMIRDNGTGGDAAKKGIGHAGMEERVRKLHGDIAFRREPSGYLVLARIPLFQELGSAAS